MVTKESVQKYIEEEAEYFMTGAIDDKLLAFLKGFHELIPPKYAAIFNAEELRDAMSGMPTIHGKFELLYLILMCSIDSYF